MSLPSKSDRVALYSETLRAIWLFEILAGAWYATGIITLFSVLRGAVHPDSVAG